MRLFTKLSLLYITIILYQALNNISPASSQKQKQQPQGNAGSQYYLQAKEYYHKSDYVNSALYFWLSLLFYKEEYAKIYTVQHSYQYFLQCFKLQEGWDISDAYGFIAYNYHARQNSKENVYEMLNEAKKYNRDKSTIYTRIGEMVLYEEEKKKLKGEQHKAEMLYNQGNKYFESKEWIKAANNFQKSCDVTRHALAIACLNAIYCRTSVADWGKRKLKHQQDNDDENDNYFDYYNEQYTNDMQMVEIVTRDEMLLYRNLNEKGIGWTRSTSAHPHSMLGYPIKDVMLKKYVAESYAETDAMYGLAEAVGHDRWKEELAKFPLDHGGAVRDGYKKDALDKNFKIRIGYMSAGVNSKAVIFLAQDVIKFHDKSKFEVHVFSTGAPDNPLFIEITMRGVDWRERVKHNADYFHDVQDVMKQGPGALAKYVAKYKIHVLIDWDGYCRNGLRAQGLYALRPAPIQIMHQEYIATSGGNYDYLVTDKIASPEHLQYLYTEKLLYMPHHFFSKGHAMQDEVLPPSYTYAPMKNKNMYVQSSGSPQENKCGFPEDDSNVSFVFCNFNKFLKFSPDTVRSWIAIMEEVPNSIMCLLENPAEGVKNLKEFITQENEEITSRFYFLPWENNPFDHQRRSFDLCNAILDCHPYNGHTTTMDALYAGVPVVTRSDGLEMSSLVTTSANLVLNLLELNAKNGISDYISIGIKLATNENFYKRIRTKLVHSCLQPSEKMHPFWDMKRYTWNFEHGLKIAWNMYLNDKPFDHITVIDDYDDRFVSFNSSLGGEEL